ncbi:MAG TPA: hypothetical protein VIS07_10685 [Candidatus Binatia bacterium]
MRLTNLRRSVPVAALLLSMLSTSGCLFFEAPQPAVPLTADEQKRVVACHKVIAKQSVKLASTMMQQLDRCANEALALSLESERELDGSNVADYVRRRQQVAARCEAGYARIGRVTTRMIDTIAARCASVESLVVADVSRGDPLGWKTLDAFIEQLSGDDLIGSIEDVAGLACSGTVESLERRMPQILPRASDLLHTYHGIHDYDEAQEYLRSFLDPRCGAMLES